MNTSETFVFWLPNLFYFIFIWNALYFWMFHILWTTYDVHENVLIFKTPHPTCLSTSKIFLPPWKVLPILSSKLWKNNCTVHVNEWNQNQSKSSHTEVDHALLLDYRTNNAMVSFSETSTNEKISCQQYIVSLSMISGHGAKPIFFNKKSTWYVYHPYWSNVFFLD